jgi:hypothetical protein
MPVILFSQGKTVLSDISQQKEVYYAQAKLDWRETDSGPTVAIAAYNVQCICQVEWFEQKEVGFAHARFDWRETESGPAKAIAAYNM